MFDLGFAEETQTRGLYEHEEKLVVSCDIMKETLRRKGRNVRFLSMPCDCRELFRFHHVLGLNLSGSVAVERDRKMFLNLCETITENFPGMRAVHGEINTFILCSESLAFDVAHLDYNGVVREGHEYAIRKLVEAPSRPLVFITMLKEGRGHRSLSVDSSSFLPDARLFFSRDYRGRTGQQMLTVGLTA